MKLLGVYVSYSGGNDMQFFGDLLRKHRRRTQDPLKGGPLTQVRLGELLGHYLGGAGYTGAAVSDWELN